MHSRAELTQRYLQDVAAALVDYIEGGGSLGIESQHDGVPLAITFTLADAERYHSLLQRRTADSYNAAPSQDGQRDGLADGALSDALAGQPLGTLEASPSQTAPQAK